LAGTGRVMRGRQSRQRLAGVDKVPNLAAVVAGYRVHKGKALAGTAEALELQIQPGQGFELIAMGSRPFVGEDCRGGGHIALDAVQAGQIRSRQESPGGLDAFLVSRPRAGAGAGAKAGGDLVAQAAGGPQERKQLALVGEDHLLWLGTVAQPKPV